MDISHLPLTFIAVFSFSIIAGEMSLSPDGLAYSWSFMVLKCQLLPDGWSRFSLVQRPNMYSSRKIARDKREEIKTGLFFSPSQTTEHPEICSCVHTTTLTNSAHYSTSLTCRAAANTQSALGREYCGVNKLLHAGQENVSYILSLLVKASHTETLVLRLWLCSANVVVLQDGIDEGWWRKGLFSADGNRTDHLNFRMSYWTWRLFFNIEQRTDSGRNKNDWVRRSGEEDIFHATKDKLIVWLPFHFLAHIRLCKKRNHKPAATLGLINREIGVEDSLVQYKDFCFARKAEMVTGFTQGFTFMILKDHRSSI